MATRRSARQRLAEEQTITADVPTKSPSRAKAPATKPKAKPAKSTAGQAKEIKTRTDTHASHGKDFFPLLPPELMAMILEHIKTPPAMSVLARTSRYFYNLIMPRLYHRISVSVAYHSHIAKFIRTIEPLLSISQKKTLKKVGQYRGQQERYSTALDAKAVPLNVRFVRQLVVGHIGPGRNHMQICIRYIEELLKNLPHLDVLHICIWTPSMAESIASMHNLQALSYVDAESEGETANALCRLKNLKHLDFSRLPSFSCLPTDVLSSLIKKSAFTLRSLNVADVLLVADVFKETDTQGNPGDGWIEMTSLHTLRMGSPYLPNAVPEFLRRSINLLKLRELEVGYFRPSIGNALPLFSELIAAFGEAHGGAPPALKRLTLNLRGLGAEAVLPVRLIYSLDTLTSLTIHGFDSSLSVSEPALSDMLQRAILKQRNLRCLRFVCWGLSSHGPLPYVPAAIVRRLVKGLPQLRELDFALAMDEIVPMSRALLRGPNLATVNIFSFQVHPTPTPDALDLVGIMAREFLSHSSEMDAKKLPEERAPFIWEREFGLRRIIVNNSRAFDLASTFGKPGKGSGNRKKPQSREFTQGDQYRVLYREVSVSEMAHLNPSPESLWLDSVQKDLA